MVFAKMVLVYHVTNDDEAGLVDVCTGLVRGVVPVLLVVSPAVRRERWPLGCEVVRADVPVGGVAGARGLLAVAAGLGKDERVCFVGCDTVVRPGAAFAEFCGAGARFVEWGGFLEAGHWLWCVGGDVAADLLGVLDDRCPRGDGLRGILSGHVAPGADGRGLSAAGVVGRLCALLPGEDCTPADFVRARLPWVHVWGVGDFGCPPVVDERCFAVWCGEPGMVRGYVSAQMAVRRAMEGAMGMYNVQGTMYNVGSEARRVRADSFVL